MNTNSTKIKFAKPLAALVFVIITFCLSLLHLTTTHATDSGLSEKELKEYSYNNIYFVNACIPGSNFSSICGSTPKEKYWSALRQHFDEVHVAAMFGSIDHEGFFGPTLWEYKLVPAGSGQFASGYTWDQLYNCNGANCPGGIGVFQITWKLGPYLQNVNSQNPDLLKYFKDPTYSLPGDQALAKIGATDYDKLVQQEIEFVLSSVNQDAFKAETDLDAATDWWTKNYENCANCCGSADADHSCEQIALRRASAHKEYDEMKDFSCSGSSSSSSTSSNTTSSSGSSHTSGSFTDDDSTASNDDITWIGDSYSVAANSKGLISEKFPNVDFGSNNSYIQVNKFVSSGDSSNPSCLTILEDVIKSNQLKPTLVFACGTNGGWSDSDITKFQNLIKDQDVNAIIVNSKIPGNDYTASNNRLQKLADSNDKITLADWVSVYDANYFDSDPEKIHPGTDPGYAKWVDAIASALGETTKQQGKVCEGDKNTTGNNDVIAAVKEIIELANKNGSTYTWGGGHTTDQSVFDAMLNGSPIDVDCTGFASLVMYKAFGKMTSFTSYSIFNDPLYEEVKREDVQPGDVFAYNSPTGHGGIVVEAKDGVVTKIAETGGPEGKSGNNTNIGYSNSNDFSVQNMNGANGHFFRFKK